MCNLEKNNNLLNIQKSAYYHQKNAPGSLDMSKADAKKLLLQTTDQFKKAVSPLEQLGMTPLSTYAAIPENPNYKAGSNTRNL